MNALPAPGTMLLTGHGMIAGVMGWPIGHSRSPLIHNHWLRQLGIDGAYVPLKVAPDAIGAAIRALPALGLRGCNVTIPHKEAAIRYCDRMDGFVTTLQAANLLVVDEDGAIEAHNTDVSGLAAALLMGAGTHGQDWSGRPALMLGAGGAARAAVAAVRALGTSVVRVANRSPEKIQALQRIAPVESVAWEDRAAATEDCALLLNMTSLGMVGQPPLEMDLARLPEDAVVFDAVYVPLETQLLARARGRGLRCVNGLDMLLHQAVPSFRALFGVLPQVTDELRRLVVASLAAEADDPARV